MGRLGPEAVTPTAALFGYVTFMGHDRGWSWMASASVGLLATLASVAVALAVLWLFDRDREARLLAKEKRQLIRSAGWNERNDYPSQAAKNWQAIDRLDQRMKSLGHRP